MVLDLAILAAGVLNVEDWLPVSGFELALWFLLVALSGLVQLSSSAGPSLTMDLPILLGVGFVHGPIFAGLVAVIGCLDIRELRREISISRAALNRAQISLSVMAAAAVFELADVGLGAWPWTALVGLAALSVDSLVNYGLVGIAFALGARPRRSTKEVLAHMRFGPASTFFPTYICFGFLSVLLAESYARLGFIGVVAFAAPVMLAQQAFVHWHRLEEAGRRLRAKSEALARVDERIADERRDERVQIASALHDEVLQSLYNVTIRAHVIKEDLRCGHLLDLDDDLPSLVSATEQAVDGLRDVIRDLRRSSIGHAGLVDTLTLLVAHLEAESGIPIVRDLDSTVHADPNTELLVYQIAREALTNAVRHSGARTIWTSLSRREKVIELVVEDDGKGFEAASYQDDRHFGLELMRERAALARGHVEIRSSPEEGTTVSAWIPA